MFPRLVTIPLESIGRSLLLAILIASAALAVAPPSSAGAVDDWGNSAGASCLYGGVEYSHGAVIKGDDGNYYICNNGEWDFDRSGVFHAPSEDQVVEPGDEAPVFDPGTRGPNVFDEPADAAPALLAP